MKAPKPRMPPAATLKLWAPAPVVGEAEAPEPVCEPEREAPVLREAPLLPLAMASEAVVDGATRRVVLLFALMVTVRVWLKADPVPARVSVWTPVPTAGMLSGSG